MVSFDYDASDPLSVFMLPPANETPEEKAEREAREAEAQRISDAIDEDLKKERAALKREKKIAKVLLLGQSESGEYRFRTSLAQHIVLMNVKISR